MSGFAKMYLVSEADYKKIASKRQGPTSLDRKLLQDSVKQVSRKRKYQSLLASLPAAARPQLKRYDVGVRSMTDKDFLPPQPPRRLRHRRGSQEVAPPPVARSPSADFVTPPGSGMRIPTIEQLRRALT